MKEHLQSLWPDVCTVTVHLFFFIYVTNSAVYLTNNSFYRVRPLSDGSNPWSTSLVKSQKSVPLAALFAEQGELKLW